MMLAKNSGKIGNREAEIPTSEIPPLKEIEIDSQKISKIPQSSLYQFKGIHVYKGRLQFCLDWVYLEKASLQIEVKGLSQTLVHSFELKPKVIYGEKTNFCFLQMDSPLWELFPTLGKSETTQGIRKILLVLELKGNSPLSSHTLIQKKILRIRMSTSKIRRYLPCSWWKNIEFFVLICGIILTLLYWWRG